ncbi:23S rRNA (adenine(1618)-N(6))-methyltransferase RlmF [Spongiimicrobium salis]|uniref:23S rRNA (adenine(1618)-N(6))-methyltransferase RlmF n=1 Tax=Spongiimicrobium salis TaxID=1667022 RepID=UPI00374D2BAF
MNIFVQHRNSLLHPKNLHNIPYDFSKLCANHPDLVSHLIILKSGRKTIDFSNKDSVFHLNKAILLTHYGLKDWYLPKDYLCAPIPGRADYIHHIYDILDQKEKTAPLRGLDIGVGANCIYPILAVQLYGWQMVGTDTNTLAVATAKKNVHATPALQERIEIRQQTDHAHIFEGVIERDDFFDFSMCNPPFYTSRDEALKNNLKKNLKLGSSSKALRNFGGQANELWCNGGEALFIKRMIKQSIAFKHQVGWFTTLIAKKEHLPKLIKQLDKVKAKYQLVPMQQGHKKSRILAWTFR